MKPSGTEDFELLLSEAIDEGLSLLGDSGKKAIYFYLDKQYDIKQHEMGARVEDFSVALEKIFGLGAVFLQTLILKRLYLKMGREYEEKDPAQPNFIANVLKLRDLEAAMYAGS